MIRPLRCIALFFTIILAAGANIAAAEKPSVFVSIVPQKFFVQQIGEGLVDVQVMVPPGASPATYEPKPRQMAALSKAQLYLAIGVPFERAWLDKISAANARMQVIHTDQGIEKLPMAAHHHHDDEHGDHHNGDHHDCEHDHGPGHHDHKHEAAHKTDNHGHGPLDPHIWLSPTLVRKQARTITSALQTIDPSNRERYETNFRRFVKEIDTLDEELRTVFTRQRGQQFMVFHPSWGYFAKDYGLKQISIEIEGKEPKPAQLQELIEHARKDGIRVIFIQPQFSKKSAQFLAREINGQVTVANPLAEAWPDNLRRVAELFQSALK